MISFNQLKKNLKKDFSGFKKIKFALLADSSSQLLHKAIKAYGYEGQIDFDIYESEYDQIELQLFDPNSELFKFKPNFIFINWSTEHLLKKFYSLDLIKQKGFSDLTIQKAREFYNAICEKLHAKVIINTFGEINDGVFGNFAGKINSSFMYQVRKINLSLMDLTQELKDLFICDMAALQSELGYHFTFNSKLYIENDQAFNIDYLPYISKNLVDIVRSINGEIKKCVIFDLDNTLWGGIIGDDGMEGIQIGGFKIGKAFTEIQLWAKQLKQRGILLAVCSKNSEEIAREPFESHPDMVLRLNDFAVFITNWETKVDNIRHIQKILNISFDSIVFIDDNPFERAIVRQSIPDVLVPELPEDPTEYLTYLRSLNLFETSSFVEEDSERTQQYQLEAQRNHLQLSFSNEDDFLSSLQMSAQTRKFDNFDIPRVAQLTQRSNQFNLRTIRYTENDISAISQSEDFFTLSISLKDKFGSYGLIAVVILKKIDTHKLFIDTWIMSCRVLKRGVEFFTLDVIMNLARQNNIDTLMGEFIATKKNGIVKDHFKNLGFEPSGEQWVMHTQNYTPYKTFINNLN